MIPPARRRGGRLARLAGDESGATLATTAMLLVVLLGFVGLGLDVGVAYTSRRAAQNAADSAALSAAVAATAGATDLTAEAQAVAAQYGLADGAGGVTVQVANPPASGPHAGDAQAVEVVITRPSQGFFSTLFSARPGPIKVRAVGMAGAAGGCMLALGKIASDGVLINGSPTVNLPNCDLDDNATSASAAMLVNGGVTVKAQAINVSGKLLQNGTVHLPAEVNQFAPPTADPYAGVKEPSYAGCSASSTVIVNGGTKTIDAGSGPYVFCNGGLIVNGGSVSFGPGVYVFNGGQFTINGGVNATATNATFVLENGASLTFNSDANITFSAPTSGPTAGMLIFSGRSNTSSVIFNANATQKFTGSLYFPNQQVIFNSATSVADGSCTQIIADSFIINADVHLELTCSGTAVPAGRRPALVE